MNCVCCEHRCEDAFYLFYFNSQLYFEPSLIVISFYILFSLSLSFPLPTLSLFSSSFFGRKIYIYFYRIWILEFFIILSAMGIGLKDQTGIWCSFVVEKSIPTMLTLLIYTESKKC